MLQAPAARGPGEAPGAIGAAPGVGGGDRQRLALDGVMTTWTDTSEVSQINLNAGVKPVKVSDETFAVIERAVDVSRRSGGVYEPSSSRFHHAPVARRSARVVNV